MKERVRQISTFIPEALKRNRNISGLTIFTLSAEFPPPSVLVQEAVSIGIVSPSEQTRGRLTDVFIPDLVPPRLLLLLEEKLAFRSPGWTRPCPWACPCRVWLLTTMGLTVAVLACRKCLSSTPLADRFSASLKKRS